MNWNYIAGFFDGEGCLTICYDKNSKIKYQISISQTDKEVLKKIQKFLGYGYVYDSDHCGNKNWKESWSFAYSLRISKRKDILSFIAKIENKLIVKKEEIKAKKKILMELDRIKNKKTEKIIKTLSISKKMREEGKSWKDIGLVVKKNAESARCFVKEHKNKEKYKHIFR